MTTTGRLIDQIEALKGTREQRALEREIKRIRDEAKHLELIKSSGARSAVENIKDIKLQILRVSDYATDYEIPIQTTARRYELDDYDSAYSEKLADLLRAEGLDVEWVRETHEPGQGSYYSFSEPRYSTTLKVSW